MSRRIDMVVVHCTDARPAVGNEPPRPFADAADIRDFHVEVNGWDDIGYHWVIERDGTVVPGRDEEIKGAHVKGHNSRSIGVCVIGGEGAEFTFTVAQMTSLLGLLTEVCERWGIRTASVAGHTEFDPRKACPVIPMDPLRAALGLWRQCWGAACLPRPESDRPVEVA